MSKLTFEKLINFDYVLALLDNILFKKKRE